MRRKGLRKMYSKKTFLSTALNSRKYKGYSTTLPESHVPTIWARLTESFSLFLRNLVIEVSTLCAAAFDAT